MPGPGSPTDVIGRGQERERIDAFLGDRFEGGRALVLRGEPGIGKTTLWWAATDGARARGWTVLSSRPAEEEMPLSGVGLFDLFDGREPPLGHDLLDDPQALGRSVLDRIRSTAVDRPLAIAIDDVQWLDSVSARAVRFALRRLDDARVAVVVAERADPLGEARDPLALPTTLSPDRTITIDLPPLDLEEIRGLIGAAISRPLLRRIHEASGGNPLYAIELARHVRGADREGASVETLTLPASVRTAIDGRLDACSDELRALLEMMAAVGRTRVVDLRAASTGDLDPPLLEGQGEGLIVVEDDLAVRFAHPVIASAVYTRMDPLVRHAMHARLAETTRDPDARARHLALSTEGPAADVADELEGAATRANRRGASDLAAGFVAHALRLTPVGDDAALRRRQISEVAYLSMAGEAGLALETADHLMDTLPHGPHRAEVLIERFVVEDDDLDLGDRLLVEAVEEAGDAVALRVRALDMLAWLRGMLRGDLPAGMACAREALALAEGMDDDHLVMLAGSTVAIVGALSGEPWPDLLERAVEVERTLQEAGPNEGPLALTGNVRFWAGDLDGASEAFEEALSEAARLGNQLARPYRLYDVALLRCARGDLEGARRTALDGIEAAEDASFPPGSLWYPLGLADAWLGRSEQARRSADQLAAWAGPRGERQALVRARHVWGFAALAEGDAAAATQVLDDAVSMLDAMGVVEPAAFPVLPEAVEAAAVAGRAERAADHLDALEDRAARVGGRWAPAALAKAQGIVHATAGDAAAAAEPLERASAAFVQMGFAGEAARVKLWRGRAFLRNGQRSHAGDALADALRRFDEIGARSWAARAREELERVAPGRAEGELTPTERRVAAAVVEGMRNREIAAALLMSVATVEAHLTRIYRKLGIRSRGELVKLVTEGSVDLTG